MKLTIAASHSVTAKVPGTIGRRVLLQCEFWLLAALLLLFMASATAQDEEQASGVTANPNTEFWRAVRQGPPPGEGISQVKGVGSSTLIAEAGQRWRVARQEYLIPWGGWLLAGMLGLILVFHMIRKGPERFDGSSSERIQRFIEYDRILHWFMAGSFIFLAVSGIILLLGRFLLLPLVGPDAFAAIASASKEGHNLFGPVFLIALILFFLRFAARNIFARYDLTWFAKGGGMLSGEHASAGFFNAGEKLLFWSVALGGVALSVSGVIMLLPDVGQSRELMQLLMLIHGIAAIGLIAFTFGHIYLATVGVPGSLSAMNTGKVDADWARAHHDRWYRECAEKGLIEKQES